LAQTAWVKDVPVHCVDVCCNRPNNRATSALRAEEALCRGLISAIAFSTVACPHTHDRQMWPVFATGVLTASI